MPRIKPLPREDLQEFDDFFNMAEAVMGFVPNSLLTLGRKPEILRAFSGLMAAVYGPGKIAPALRSLISYVASNAAGCLYCQAHTAHTAHGMAVSEEKLKAAFEFETSALFTDAERAALRVAAHGAMVPNAVTDEDFDELRKHYDDEEIVEIVTTLSLFGFLNRWNNTMATELEATPLRFAKGKLVHTGWEAGMHAAK